MFSALPTDEIGPNMPRTTDEAARYGQIDRAYASRLAAEGVDAGPVWMINLMKYRDRAHYADGRADDISGREADDRYTPLEALAKVGAEIVFVGDVERQLLGDAPMWDRVGVVKYPSGTAFIDMWSLPEFQRQHVHKDAGMEHTIVIGGRPMELPGVNDASVGWSEVPHPPTGDDPAVMVIHVLAYHESTAGATPEQMAAYQEAAGRVAQPHGVRVDGWFTAEGTIVGDGRSWDQIRFNAFPSAAAFMAVVTDPTRLEAQRNHREKAIADTYALMVRPIVDRLAESIGHGDR
jgi:uncharacterized protein (DUF1330 family)